MRIVYIIVTVVLALMSSASAALKLQQKAEVVDTIHGTVGVPLERLPMLAGVQLLGVLGLIVGIWVPWIGVAAAAGLMLYFAAAVAAHLRVSDSKGAAGPMPFLMLSFVALALRLVTMH